MTGSVWSWERPAPMPWETLSRGQIVRVALETLDADGLAGLNEIDVPEPELAGWRSGVTLFAHSFRAAILRPWSHEVATTTPSIGPNAVVLSERLLNPLRAAGFTGVDVDMAAGSSSPRPCHAMPPRRIRAVR